MILGLKLFKNKNYTPHLMKKKFKISRKSCLHIKITMGTFIKSTQKNNVPQGIWLILQTKNMGTFFKKKDNNNNNIIIINRYYA